MAQKGDLMTARSDIRVLDATIRDGGLVNNFMFSDDFINALYRTNVKAGVDYMEFGYKASKELFDVNKFGKWKFCDEESIREIVGDNNSDMKISVMADVGRCDYKKDIIDKKDSVIDMVRVATYVHQMPAAIEMIEDAKAKGYKKGRFSFNVKGGRCETCKGNGYKTIEMNFLPDVLVPCEDCHGKRYNRETLEVRFRGKSIADILDMTINMAVEFFENIPTILSKIKVLQDVGLGYIKLGQPSTTLSGGESQRVKLATELAKRDTGKTLYVLDEPTTGLHFEDIRVLLGVLNKLVDKGNTIIVIEHNLDVIKSADYLIDMGPEGGRRGGNVLFTGTPEALAKSGVGFTAPFLKEELDIANKKK